MYSGGKDSTFAMYVAEQMGHDIPYLVTVRPEDSASWIFHTPNLSVVPAMAEAMGRELVTIASDGTEGGDLKAMSEVLSGLDIDGIVVGALWSDYQWDRMNMVCGDLGLIVLAPLWRKDQDMIYDEMVSAGISAVVAGVFAEGLDGDWLGRPLDMDAKTELCRLRDRYGISIMGEGGEYESMTVDSPMHLRSIAITDSEKVMERTSGTLHVKDVALREKRSQDVLYAVEDHVELGEFLRDRGPPFEEDLHVPVHQVELAVGEPRRHVAGTDQASVGGGGLPVLVEQQFPLQTHPALEGLVAVHGVVVDADDPDPQCEQFIDPLVESSHVVLAADTEIAHIEIHQHGAVLHGLAETEYGSVRRLQFEIQCLVSNLNRHLCYLRIQCLRM